ncbi:hypothetical protein LIER_30710 [Lithospermum erythrorhizon]|uniref:Uncharacterized protein n=1 Tax=Lithospermum erythrorhizon TaxID=34254 RepID=A0AAV3RNN5_LITER
MNLYKLNLGHGKHLKEVIFGILGDPYLPPVRNTSSTDELLRECEVANPQTFIPDNVTDGDEVLVYAAVDALDRRLGGGSHHVHGASDSSSEEDEMEEEQAGHPSSLPANSMVRGLNSEATQVPRGHARPHITDGISLHGRREALHVAKTDDMRELIGKLKLPLMQTQDVWNSFVKHWTAPKALQLSESEKKSRGTQGAGEHGLGNVGLKNQIRTLEEKIGVQPLRS